MIALCRLWLRLAVAIGLVLSCNVAAPAISAAADPTILTNDMPCHDRGGKADLPPAACTKACLAIPATSPWIEPAVASPMARFAGFIPIFSGQEVLPDTPPPRLARDA